MMYTSVSYYWERSYQKYDKGLWDMSDILLLKLTIMLTVPKVRAQKSGKKYSNVGRLTGTKASSLNVF